MYCYHYHPESKLYVGCSEADPDPLTPDEYLVPAYATLKEPIETRKNEAVMFCDGEWEIVPDWRGFVYYTSSGEKIEIDEINVVPPKDAKTDPPEPEVSEVANEQIEYINFLCDKELKCSYPEAETRTWDKQEKEARAYVSDQSSDVPLITFIADQRGIDIMVLAKKIIKKSEEYTKTVGTAIGKRQKIKDEIISIMKDKKKSDDEKRKEIRNISW